MLPLGDQFPLGYEPVFHIMAISGPVVFIVQISTVRDFRRGGIHNRRAVESGVAGAFGIWMQIVVSLAATFPMQSYSRHGV